ncbi:hypothetical protein HDV00_007530 [Rhizophlyctis rosea]|nr:hypothetical protein HDV00_007530 [Rhizophlyctis rosea]
MEEAESVVVVDDEEDQMEMSGVSMERMGKEKRDTILKWGVGVGWEGTRMLLTEKRRRKLGMGS